MKIPFVFHLCIEYAIVIQPCFSSYSEQVFLTKATSLLSFHLIVLRCHPYYISVLPGLSSGLHILFHSFFLFAYCWGRITLMRNAVVLMLISELREGANSQCLFTILSGHIMLSLLNHFKALDRHYT